VDVYASAYWSGRWSGVAAEGLPGTARAGRDARWVMANRKWQMANGESDGSGQFHAAPLGLERVLLGKGCIGLKRGPVTATLRLT